MNIIILTISLAFSFSATAGQYTGAGNISNFRQIDDTGTFVMMGSWDTSKADGCTNTSKWIVGAHPAYSDRESTSSAYSLVMAAYMANKTVELYIDGCDASGKPIVSTIWLPSRD